jgi:hypothetical protein
MRFLVLATLLLLTSCEAAPLSMSIEQKGGALVVEVFTKWWLGVRSNDTPCVHDVELVRDGRVLWRMSVQPDRQCADLRSFVIGRAPKGFGDEGPLASPLAPGDYTLSASGIGEGKRDFKVPLH